ncbi:16S rRNA (cytosine(1402)-N(4))-methyltransferase RsmH, partial [Candidatus Microgenomates bacterium]|nr:16S rRNA (cytosine(1402)-N(4))-methyltransferase RsmH [Candidatus Microgenomates bacterium]
MEGISKNYRAGVGDEFHKPVLLEEALKSLNIKRGKWYVDCTLGGGNYSYELFKLGANVLSIEVDEEAIDFVKRKFGEKKNWLIIRDNFKNLKKIVNKQRIRVFGVVFDLGVSLHQLRSTERGFSFNREAILDMRMDTRASFRAVDLVNQATKEELYEIFAHYGEEKRSWAVADAILRARLEKKIATTLELAKIVESVVGKSLGGKNSATRVFQALRIYVNDELNNLKTGLEDAIELLEKDGRVVIISYHSLEDR